MTLNKYQAKNTDGGKIALIKNFELLHQESINQCNHDEVLKEKKD